MFSVKYDKTCKRYFLISVGCNYSSNNVITCYNTAGHLSSCPKNIIARLLFGNFPETCKDSLQNISSYL